LLIAHMTVQQRASAFVHLGLYLQQLAARKRDDKKFKHLNELFFDDAQKLFSTVKLQNGWFTEANVRLSVSSLARLLDERKMKKWMAMYTMPSANMHPKKVGLVMAGNIPLVGFHDFLCVLMSGNSAIVKLSGDD